MTLLHEPTLESITEVERLAGVGLPQKMIAAVIGICETTLVKHYAENIERGRGLIGAKVATCLVDKCLAGDTTAMIFYAKTQLRWKETSISEITGENGTALSLNVHFVSAKQNG